MTQPKQPISDREIYETLARMTATGQDGILVTVVETRLSTPRHEGSKMVVHVDGTITGSVGGGRSEARVIEVAGQVFKDRKCCLLDLDLTKGLGVCGGSMQVFLEPVLQSSPFIIIGAGHVGRAMVEVGRALPFHFILVDDRPEFLESWKEVPGVQTILSTPEELVEKIDVTERTAVLLSSRNHTLDTAYLEATLRSEMASSCQFPFVGVLGSRSKALRILGLIKKLGDDFATRMENVSMPVGLDIAAETPQEIALSILAQAQSTLRGVEPLRNDKNEAVGIPLHSMRKPKTNPKPKGSAS